MKLANYLDQRGVRGVSGLIYAVGSFGTIDGDTMYALKAENGVQVYEYVGEKVRLTARFTEHENGVIIRKDTFENLSDESMQVCLLSSRFRLPGNKYDVYTQYNGWQHESLGEWQPLVTQIVTAGQGIRSCHTATPMMALHNAYTKKNVIFHLFPNGLWKITARKFPQGKNEVVVVETGFDNNGMNLSVAPKGKIELPTIMFYEADNQTDLDAYKLHQVYNTLYPRKTLPILYNTWLHCFDTLDIDDLKRQADTAKELGIEAFMVDAGWFGDGPWEEGVGDWTENLTEGPKGRLAELSKYIRDNGMVFGLWFEPERAGLESRAVKEHPEYFINERFFDFANEEARAHMIDVIGSQIEKYHIGWLKFDFNDSIPLDESGNVFYYYMQGQKCFIEDLCKKYPHVYITNCAGGGSRMELEQGSFTDSFWLSDNQGPLEGIRIVKDTLKRMPTGLIERWNVQKGLENTPVYGQKLKPRMIHTNDGLWGTIVGVNDAFSENFMLGGPMGFSCDLAAFPEEYKLRWKEVIAQYKQDREFYRTAIARILIDDPEMIGLEYADKDLDRCIIQIFTKQSYVSDLIVYPVVDKTATYSYQGVALTGEEILKDGLYIKDMTDYTCVCFEVKKV